MDEEKKKMKCSVNSRRLFLRVGIGEAYKYLRSFLEEGVVFHMNRKIYAAYGSNMNTADMKKRCPQSDVVTVGSLCGWRLTFRGNETGYANVEPDKTGTVPVVLWEISEECESALDEYEEYPTLYEKEVVSIETKMGSISAMLYRMTLQYRNRLSIPATDYMKCLRHGYAEHGCEEDGIEAALQEVIRLKEGNEKKMSSCS